MLFSVTFCPWHIDVSICLWHIDGIKMFRIILFVIRTFIKTDIGDTNLHNIFCNQGVYKTNKLPYFARR